MPHPFPPGQADELPNSITQQAHRNSKKLISSQATTERPPDRGTDSQQAVRHTTCGALRNSQGLDGDFRWVREGEREAKTEDDPKLTGVQKMCHTVHPSITLGNTFPDVCVWLCLRVLS